MAAMKLLAAFVCLALFALSACTTPGISPPDASTDVTGGPTATVGPMPQVQLPECEWARVTRVVDGDTVHVSLAGADTTVRYIGMDTSESVKPGVPVQPFAREAAHRNEELVLGRWVCMEHDAGDTDRYGRLLRWLWLEDGRMVNEVLVQEGLAVLDTVPPNVKYVESRIVPAQHAAREAGRGVWAGE
jgi:micrococcal nuclease